MSIRTRRRNTEQPATGGAITTVHLDESQTVALLDYYHIAVAAELLQRDRLNAVRAAQEDEIVLLRTELAEMNGVQR